MYFTLPKLALVGIGVSKSLNLTNAQIAIIRGSCTIKNQSSFIQTDTHTSIDRTRFAPDFGALNVFCACSEATRSTTAWPFLF